MGYHQSTTHSLSHPPSKVLGFHHSDKDASSGIFQGIVKVSIHAGTIKEWSDLPTEDWRSGLTLLPFHIRPRTSCARF